MWGRPRLAFCFVAVFETGSQSVALAGSMWGTVHLSSLTVRLQKGWWRVAVRGRGGLEWATMAGDPWEGECRQAWVWSQGREEP